MILLISNELDVTADFFEEKLKVAKVPYLRMNTPRLPDFLVEFRLVDDSVRSTFRTTTGECFDLEDFRSIYYRRPKPPTVPGEFPPTVRPWVQHEYRQLWGALLNVNPQRKWVNHPLAISAANYKPEQLARAMRLGLSVPDTLITSDPSAVTNFCQSHHWRVIAKPIGHGQIRGEHSDEDQLIYTNLIGDDDHNKLSLVRYCPTLFQAYVDKAFDLRVTVVDEQCIAVRLHSQESDVSRIDCRRNNMEGMRYTVTELPAEIHSKLVRLTESYDLHFAAIDMGVDRTGHYWFFELNPAGQWAWLEQQVGVPISTALIQSLSFGDGKSR